MRNCDGCGIELTPVFPTDYGRRREDFPLYEDALVVTIKGGFGMLIDEFVPSAVLCKECGIKAVQTNPWLVTPETEHLTKGEISVTEDS